LILGSGTLTTPILGSIVQNGKLALCALALDKQLNKVDFPTLGNPTIPAFMIIYFRKVVITTNISNSINKGCKYRIKKRFVKQKHGILAFFVKLLSSMRKC
jgi:hypothetical protein